jgi:hypothetical protein
MEGEGEGGEAGVVTEARIPCGGQMTASGRTQHMWGTTATMKEYVGRLITWSARLRNSLTCGARQTVGYMDLPSGANHDEPDAMDGAGTG